MKQNKVSVDQKAVHLMRKVTKLPCTCLLLNSMFACNKTHCFQTSGFCPFRQQNNAFSLKKEKKRKQNTHTRGRKRRGKEEEKKCLIDIVLVLINFNLNHMLRPKYKTLHKGLLTARHDVILVRGKLHTTTHCEMSIFVIFRLTLYSIEHEQCVWYAID